MVILGNVIASLDVGTAVEGAREKPVSLAIYLAVYTWR